MLKVLTNGAGSWVRLEDDDVGQFPFHGGRQVRQSADVHQLLVDRLEILRRSFVGPATHTHANRNESIFHHLKLRLYLHLIPLILFSFPRRP